MRKISISAVVFIYCLLLIVPVKAEEVKEARVEDRYSKILVISKAVEALGKIGNPKSRDVLVKALKSKEFLIRASAAQALGRIQDKESIPILEGLVNDKNYLVRVLATGALVELGEDKMKGPFLAFLKDNDPKLRAIAVEAMQDMAEDVERLKEELLFSITEMLPNEKDYIVKAKAIKVIGYNKYAPALDYVNQAINDTYADVRNEACIAAGEIGDKGSLPLLLKRLEDESLLVRAAAKEALGKFGDRSQIKLFWKEIDEENSLLKAGSYIALAYLGELDILPVLLREIIAAENPLIIRKQTAKALVQLKPHISDRIYELLEEKETLSILLLNNIQFDYRVEGENLISIITQALGDENNPLHQDAPIILKELKSKLALPALREALLQGNPVFVARVAYVLGELKDKEATEYLYKVLKEYGI